MKEITEKDILQLVKKLIEFPDTQVCKHYVALQLLSLLEAKGVVLSNSLVTAVVASNDEEIIRLIV